MRQPQPPENWWCLMLCQILVQVLVQSLVQIPAGEAERTVMPQQWRRMLLARK
ncbi:hypothetical protein [Bifidobacterium olomucense]|uniref:hypothetical protein n=1 Tax=Bifidobacterium olomucense TaxID=2675324 RepID=UPI003AA94A24